MSVARERPCYRKLYTHKKVKLIEPENLFYADVTCQLNRHTRVIAIACFLKNSHPKG